MLQHTFQLIPGVGPWREKDLWARGIHTWKDFPQTGVVLGRKLDELARERLTQAREALDRRDLGTLARLVPPREHWRLYPEFHQEAVFFDIETDGAAEQVPTVVGLFDSAGLHVFIQGRNLEALPEALASRQVWVSFNGSCFDVPVLRSHFGPRDFPTPPLHIDLRFVCRRLGMGGGLKEIEDQLGLGRPPHLRGVNGWDAVLLWRAFREHGELEALRFLVEYNLYDAFQLRSLMDLAYNRGADELHCDVPRLPVFERGDVLYDVSQLILALGPAERDPHVLERVRAWERRPS